MGAGTLRPCPFRPPRVCVFSLHLLHTRRRRARLRPRSRGRQNAHRRCLRRRYRPSRRSPTSAPHRPGHARARPARRGLRALPAYHAGTADALPPATHGYRAVRGRVLRINEAPHAIWLELQGRFAIRIDRDDLRYFSVMPLHDLLRREVEVRARVYPVGDELHLKLRHPAYLERNTPKNNNTKTSGVFGRTISATTKHALVP